jgi:hypothetical protein
MGSLNDKLGGRTPGELIEAQDWNDLVAAVAAAEGQLAALSAQTVEQRDQDRKRLDLLEKRTAHLLRVTLKASPMVTAVLGPPPGGGAPQQAPSPTHVASVQPGPDPQARHVFGETAEIIAVVEAFPGTPPLDLANEVTRPWVDFVSTWGELRPEIGFKTLAGSGAMSFSVQVNAQGEAKVLLRAPETEGWLTEANGRQVGILLATPLDGRRRVADGLLQAATPKADEVQAIFKRITPEYERRDRSDMRTYLDAYLRGVVSREPQKLNTQQRDWDGWNDFRATILAFVRGASDSSTAEPNRGSCSVQVTFRDWIDPWLHLGYFGPAAMDALTKEMRTKLLARVKKGTQGVAETAQGLNAEVTQQIVSRLPVGNKLRACRCLRDALTTLSVPDAGFAMAMVTPQAQNSVTAGLQDVVKSALAKPGFSLEVFDLLTQQLGIPMVPADMPPPPTA